MLRFLGFLMFNYLLNFADSTQINFDSCQQTGYVLMHSELPIYIKNIEKHNNNPCMIYQEVAMNQDREFNQLFNNIDRKINYVALLYNDRSQVGDIVKENFKFLMNKFDEKLWLLMFPYSSSTRGSFYPERSFGMPVTNFKQFPYKLNFDSVEFDDKSLNTWKIWQEIDDKAFQAGVKLVSERNVPFIVPPREITRDKTESDTRPSIPSTFSLVSLLPENFNLLHFILVAAMFLVIYMVIKIQKSILKSLEEIRKDQIEVLRKGKQQKS